MTQSSVHPVVRNLAHDLRQPLSTIENCVYFLKLIAAGNDPRIRVHLDLIEQQVEEAERILCEAVAQRRDPRPAPVVAEDSFDLTSATTAALT